MKKQNNTEITSPPVNLKEKNASHTFRVTIRDRDHFYKLVNWLNTNVGKGVKNWTFEGRVLKTLKQGKIANPKVYIFKEGFDESSSVYLNLL